MSALAVCAVAAAGGGQASTPDRETTAAEIVSALEPCPVESAAPTSKVTLPGSAFPCDCAGLTGEQRLCKCRSGAPGGSLRVVEGGRAIGEVIPAAAYLGDTSRFLVQRVPLAGWSQPRLVIANHTGSSNGIGVEYWHVSVWLDGLPAGVPAVQAHVEEFGDGSLVRHTGEQVCRLLATEWLYDEEPGRGSGLYLVGRLYDVTLDGLVPVLRDGAVLSRRYLYRFQDERFATDPGTGAPLTWFRDSTTRLVRDPYLATKVVADADGHIVEVAPREDGGWKLEVVFDVDGGTAMLSYPAPDHAGDAGSVQRLGDLASGGLFPRDYWPRPAEGQRIRFSDRASARRTGNVLWLGPTSERDLSRP